MGRRINFYFAGMALTCAMLGAAAVVNPAITGIPMSMIPMLAPWWQDSDSSEDAADPGLSPAEVIALRFPDQPEEASVFETEALTKFEVSGLSPTDAFELALFSPHPTYPQITAQLDIVPQALAQPAPKTAPLAAKPVVVASTRREGRPDAVFNDAQISTIKGRLKLTPEQQHMWPAVEAALRNLSYPKKGHRPGVDVTRVAAIDPNSTEVQNLNSAAMPLVMSFSNEQRRELRVLAHVAGLEDLVPKF